MDRYESNKKLLVKHFEEGSKKESNKKLGVEIEHFVVRRQTLKSVTYYDKQSIRDMLETLSPLYPHRFEKDGHLIGLYNDEYSLSLEPAGQLEISINPQVSIGKIEDAYQNLLKQMKPFLRENNYQLITLGYQPSSKVEELPLIPKKRYEFMDQYFAKVGTGGIHMMRGTASTQVAIDYVDEADFVLKYRVAYILMPLLLLLTDNAPIFKGQMYDGYLLRNYIWEHVDKDRTGMIPGMFDEDFGFAKYADYLMQLPLIFMPFDEVEEYTDNKNITEIKPEQELSEADIEHILSMAFLDVRLKNYIEIRFADSMPFEYVKGYMALIKGVFYNDKLLRRISEEYKVGEAEIQAAKDCLSKDGFEGVVYGQPVDKVLAELLEDAKEGLNTKERAMLRPLEQIVKNKETLAEEYDEKTIS